MSESTAHRKDETQIVYPSVVFLDDRDTVCSSIYFHAKHRGYKDIHFALSTEAAFEMLKNKRVQFFVTDFELEGSDFNGVSFLKYLKSEDVFHFQAIIYSEKKDHIADDHKRWCGENKIPVIKKTPQHLNLFELIESYDLVTKRLPSNPKYSSLTNAELILSLAEELIVGLEKKPDALHFFGGNTSPLSTQDLLKEIKRLSPLGKEYLGTWFASVKSSLRFLEKERFKNRQK